jgi:hypothetical protein
MHEHFVSTKGGQRRGAIRTVRDKHGELVAVLTYESHNTPRHDTIATVRVKEQVYARLFGRGG